MVKFVLNIKSMSEILLLLGILLVMKVSKVICNRRGIYLIGTKTSNS